VGLLDWFRSWLSRRVSPVRATTAAPVPVVGAGTGAPFDHWSILLLGGHALIVVTDDGVYERIGKRVWVGHSVGYHAVSHQLEVCEWLEAQAHQFWSSR